MRAALALVVLLPLVAAAESKESSDDQLVVELGNENFTSIVSSAEHAVVVFYIPWSRACNRFRPELERAARVARDEGLPFTMMRVNGDAYEDLVEEFGVKKYPGIYVYLDGQPTAYDGGATADALLYHLRNSTGREPGTPAKQLSGKVETLKWAFWRGNPGDVLLPTLVASFPEAAAEGQREAYATWTQLAYNLSRQGFRVAEVHDTEAISALRLDPSRPSLAMVREFDEGKVIFDGPFTTDALSEFVTVHNVPMVAFVDHTTLRAHQQRKHWLVHLFVEPEGAEQRTKMGRYYQKRMDEVARLVREASLLQRGQFTIAISDGRKYHEWMSAFRLKKEEFPALAVVDQATDTRWAYGKLEGNVAEEAFEYLNLVVKGRLTPIPEHDAGSDARAQLDKLDELERHVAESSKDEL